MFAVETEGLTRRFGDFTAVDNLTIQIEIGAIYGFLGPNGSGKSTTIRMLCGLLLPTAGKGQILGHDIFRQAKQIKNSIGYMSQKFSLYDDLTVRENLRFYGGMYSLAPGKMQQRIEEMIAMADLTGREDELAANLSGGWKQRLALGCSILHQPKILFLDEPTGGVDPRSRRMFWDIIYDLAAQGTTVMVTTHFMDEAEHCDQIGFIFEGKLIAADRPDALKTTLPGILLEVPTEDPMGLYGALQGEKVPCLDLYPYGNSIHILTAPDKIGCFSHLKAQEIQPTLEDVFVYYVKSNRREAAQ